jgi:hypothetical protein
MKSKLVKVMGVLATLATIASLFVSAVPAAAAPQAWEKITTPGNIDNMVDLAVLWVGPIERAINGDLFTAVGFGEDSETVDDPGVYLFRSTDFGRTWTILNSGDPISTFPEDTETPPPFGVPYTEDGVIYDIECSSTNASILYVTDGYDIFKSINAGKTWVVMDNLFEEEALDVQPSGLIVSIAVGNYANTAYIFAATSTFGGGNGGAYVFQESIFLSQWIDLEVGEEREDEFSGDIDVVAIDTFPDFTTTQGIVAVVSDYVNAETHVTTRFMGQQWAENASDVLLAYNVSGIFNQADVDAVLLDAVIWMPSDFSSDFGTGNMVLFVGINPLDGDAPLSATDVLVEELDEVEQGDVFLCYFGDPEDDETGMAIDLDIRGSNTGTAVSDLDGMGAGNTAELLASGYTPNNWFEPNTWASQDAGITWMQAAKRPTGGISPLWPVALSSLRVHPNFATNGVAVVGTHGNDAGLSISQLPTDVCATGFTWNTINFISTVVDQKVDMSITTDNTIYLSTFEEREVDSIPGGQFIVSAAHNADVVTPLVLADTIELEWGNLSPPSPPQSQVAAFVKVISGNFAFDEDGTDTTIQDVSGITDDEWDYLITFYDSNDVAYLSATQINTRLVINPVTVIADPITISVEEDNGTGDVVIGGNPYEGLTVEEDDVWVIDLPDIGAASFSTPAWVATDFYLDVASGLVSFNGFAGTITPVPNAAQDNGPYHVFLTQTNPRITVTAIEDSIVFIYDPVYGAATTVPAATGPGYTGTFTAEFDEEEPLIYALGAPVEGGTLQLFSLWRYMDTTGDGVRDWERVNSYSLYEVFGMEVEDSDLFVNPFVVSFPVDFDFVRATPANDAVITVDRDTHEVLISTNKGNLWTSTHRPVPFGHGTTVTGDIYSVLLLSAKNIMVGVDEGTVYYTVGLGIWQTRQAFDGGSGASVGPVTDLRKASNNDIIAAGVGSASTVWVARSVYSATNTTYADWANDVDTKVAVDEWAFAAPANDYATSNVIYVTSDDAGIYYRTYTGTSNWTRADNDASWYNSDGAEGEFEEEEAELGERFLTNLQTAPGGPGFTAEGTGMAYLTSFSVTDSVSSGLARIKGRVASADTRAGELIPRPRSGSTNIDIGGLWNGPASVGSVLLYTFGSDCNIWFFTDTLNQAITGLVAPAASVMIDECPTCPCDYQAKVTWAALPNVSYYFVYVTVDAQAMNVYDALRNAAEEPEEVDASTDFIMASFTTGTSVTMTGLTSQTTFYVSVWGIRPLSKATTNLGSVVTLTGTTDDKAFDVINTYWSTTTFGAGVNFTTPACPPTVLSPSAGAGDVRVRPTFQ